MASQAATNAAVRTLKKPTDSQPVKIDPPDANVYAGCFVLLYDEKTVHPGFPGGTYTVALYIDTSSKTVSFTIDKPALIVDVPWGFQQSSLKGVVNAYLGGGGDGGGSGADGGGGPGDVLTRP